MRISKVVRNWSKELLKDPKDTEKALQLVYNAGYKMGLKARKTEGATHVPDEEINERTGF